MYHCLESYFIFSKVSGGGERDLIIDIDGEERGVS